MLQIPMRMMIMITYHLGLVFITDQEDTDLRMQQLTGGLPPPEESFDDSMDEDQSEFLQKIGKDPCSKEQFGKPLNTTPFSFIKYYTILLYIRNLRETTT